MRGIGPVRAGQLAAVGLSRVGDLLRVLPRRYEDRRTLSRIDQATAPGAYTLRGRLEGVARVRIRRRGLSLVRGRLRDDTGTLPALWFNRPYLAQQIDPANDYLLHGTVRRGRSGLELLNPSVEKIDAGAEGPGRLAARILPVYPSLGDLGPGRVAALVENALEQTRIEPEPADELPADLCRRHDLPGYAEALLALHRPGPTTDVEALNGRTSRAHARLAYQELLELQLELAFVRRRVSGRRKRRRYDFGVGVRERVEAIPPFELTAAQTRVFGELATDLTSSRPMSRLVQGDVGCGKTVVAAMAMALAAENGLQAALMAPTELLAEQHCRSLRRFLGDRYRVELVSASAADAGAARRRLATGKTPLAVGTHALIQDATAFQHLGLVVVDEQHRFGVAQRRRLEEKGRRPDLLVMTATPIPRSLALTVYGDLDLSVIDELPPGRRPVSTRLVEAAERRRVLSWLAERLAAGEQAYVVCPLIEASEAVDAASIESWVPELERHVGGQTWEVLHGRTSPAERERIVAGFTTGSIRLLLATTVIEVGVDVPAATVMVIDSAERFGLAQLHQLRGRVGRGESESVCVALHGPASEESARRLEVFATCHDGFALAEADLEIRGPGDFLGTRQSGAPFLRVASLVRDRPWLEKARTDAAALVATAGEGDGDALVEAARQRARDLERRLAGA